MRATKQTPPTLTLLLLAFLHPVSGAAAIHSVPFELERGYLVVVTGKVESRPLRIKIDTGATHTILDHRTARTLGIKSIKRTHSVHAFGRSKDLERAVVKRLRLGDYSLPPFPCFLGDVSFIGADMILGLDVLRRRSLTIDYEGRQIHFGAGPVEGVPARLEMGSTLALIQMEIQGNPVTLAIDSGAPRINLFRQRIAEWREELTDRGRTRIETLAGKSRVRKVELDRIRVSGLLWENQEAFLLEQRPDTPADGVLGLGSLGLQRIHFDFARQEVLIVP